MSTFTSATATHIIMSFAQINHKLVEQSHLQLERDNDNVIIQFPKAAPDEISYNTLVSACSRHPGETAPRHPEGGMIRSETSSSSNLSSRAIRAYPLIEIRQAVPCRAIRGNSISANGTLQRPEVRGRRRGPGAAEADGRARPAGRRRAGIQSYVYIYIYMYICICICVYVCLR